MTVETMAGKEVTTALVQMVTFHVGREEYAVDILSVKEIIRVQTMTRVPNTPAYLKGVINLRGRIVPVLNLRERLHMEPEPSRKSARIVVVERMGKTVGLVVDSMSEVLSLPESFILSPPDTSDGSGHTEFIQGVVKLDERLLVFLNLETLLGGNDL